MKTSKIIYKTNSPTNSILYDFIEALSYRNISYVNLYHH